MIYSRNGNINTRTGMGTYTYGSASKPHAVTAVDNTSGDIDYNSQDVSYNNWNRVSSVWQYYDDDCYGYSIEYGPDLRRVRSQFHTYNNLIYDMFYWDDYEEKTVGTDTLKYYYLYTSGELDALHIIKSGPSGVSTHTTKVITDHLGSITGLADNYYMAYLATFDAWGNRDVYIPYWFDRTFNRGYTEHEHIDELGLINMNGRMYDSRLGRFLSPDPFVQVPTDPQNYNRYSYCLNNPLKYTDPEGESLLLTAAIAAALLFTDDGYYIQNFLSPIAIHVDFHLGSNQIGLGYDVSIGLPTSTPISYRFHYGETYYWKTYGNNSGWEYRKGGEWGVKGLQFGIPYDITYSGTKFSGINNQTTNSVTLSKLPFIETTYENDTQMFVKLPGVPKYDKQDRYRTAAVRIKRGPFALQTNLHTGMAESVKKKEENGNTIQHFDGGDIDQQHHGVLSINIGLLRLGADTEGIRHTFQNRLAHDWFWIHNYGEKYPWVLKTDKKGSFYFQLSSGTGNTLW